MNDTAYIYGVFVTNERCLYVGRTQNFAKRSESHVRRFTAELGRAPNIRVLRSVPVAKASEIELAEIARRKRQGEATFNRTFAHHKPPRSIQVSARLAEQLTSLGIFSDRTVADICDEYFLPRIEKRLARRMSSLWAAYFRRRK